MKKLTIPDVIRTSLYAQLFDGFQPSEKYKLQQALEFLGTKYVLHPKYNGNHSYRS